MSSAILGASAACIQTTSIATRHERRGAGHELRGTRRERRVRFCCSSRHAERAPRCAERPLRYSERTPWNAEGTPRTAERAPRSARSTGCNHSSMCVRKAATPRTSPRGSWHERAIPWHVVSELDVADLVPWQAFVATRPWLRSVRRSWCGLCLCLRSQKGRHESHDTARPTQILGGLVRNASIDCASGTGTSSASEWRAPSNTTSREPGIRLASFFTPAAMPSPLSLSPQSSNVG